jgi:hypothetical protein
VKKHEQCILSSIDNYASVNTCGCCKNEVLHVNFYNTTVRMTKDNFKDYVTMLNEAMMKIDETGEFCETLGSMYRYFSYLQSCDSISEE